MGYLFRYVHHHKKAQPHTDLTLKFCYARFFTSTDCITYHRIQFLEMYCFDNTHGHGNSFMKSSEDLALRQQSFSRQDED